MAKKCISGFGFQVSTTIGGKELSPFLSQASQTNKNIFTKILPKALWNNLCENQTRYPTPSSASNDPIHHHSSLNPASRPS